MFRKLTDSVYASPQIGVDEVAEAKALGVALIVNNRPEGESGDQTPGEAIAAAAQAAGIDYVAIPVTHAGFSEPQVVAMRAALNRAGDSPVLAYCRSGTRSTLLWALAMTLPRSPRCSTCSPPRPDERPSNDRPSNDRPSNDWLRMIAQGLQFAGSLAAILLLAWFAHRLGLGGDPRLRDADEARRLAGEALDGFEADELVLDRAGIGALLRDSAGRVMVLRRHGARWAARLLDRHAGVRLDRTFMTIVTSDRRFGAITLDLGDQAQTWASSLRRIR